MSKEGTHRLVGHFLGPDMDNEIWSDSFLLLLLFKICPSRPHLRAVREAWRPFHASKAFSSILQHGGSLIALNVLFGATEIACSLLKPPRRQILSPD